MLKGPYYIEEWYSEDDLFKVDRVGSEESSFFIYKLNSRYRWEFVYSCRTLAEAEAFVSSQY